MGPIEVMIIDEHREESDHEEETIQTANDDKVSSSLASGALSQVCDVAAVMRELENTGRGVIW